MITAFLYFLSGFLFFALFIFFIIDYENTRNKYVFYYALAFLLMYLFVFTLSVPVLVIPDHLTLLSYSYIGAIFFGFSLILLCLKIQMLVTNHFFKKHFHAFFFLVSALGVVTLYLAIKNLNDPVVTDIAVIMNIDTQASWLIGGLSLIYGLFWAYLFRKTARLLQDATLRRRMMVLSLNGVLYGAGAFTLFTNQTMVGQLLSMAFFFASVLWSGNVFLIPTLQDFLKRRKDLKAI